ncbi:MAG TPA: MBL fold metallo-hydrolase [Candidatus Eisenbacteria bacterium]|jgi:pyrroloquinoline quinone biosynthesis protein B
MLHRAFVAVSLVAFLVALAAGLPTPATAAVPRPYVLVLGIAQDGGVPQAGCRKRCCTSGRHEDVASLALVEPAAHRWWLFDATPNFASQLARVAAEAPACSLSGIFLTHAHIGHYTGLMYLGREAMGAHDVPVWAMPRMREFLSKNGPWDQLVSLHNIALEPLQADTLVTLSDSLNVTPFLVPHRDEYSETVGFRIASNRGVVVFVPDIDKWERWDRQVEALVAHVNAAYLDGTFFDGTELPGRDMREIPHPFIVESLARFAALPAATRARIHFIHLNHTNPAAIAGTPERRRVEAAGCRVARAGERTEL